MGSLELDLLPTIGIRNIATPIISSFRIIVLGCDILVLRWSILFHLVVRLGRSTSTHVKVYTTKAQWLLRAKLGTAYGMFESYTAKTWYEVVNTIYEGFAVELIPCRQDFPQTSLYLIGYFMIWRQDRALTWLRPLLASLIAFHSTVILNSNRRYPSSNTWILTPLEIMRCRSQAGSFDGAALVDGTICKISVRRRIGIKQSLIPLICRWDIIIVIHLHSIRLQHTSRPLWQY